MDDVKIGEILSPGSEREQASRRERVLRDFWKTVRKAATRVPFMDEVVAAYFAAMDPATPLRVRGILFAALAYFVMPIDTIPDVLLAFGFTDDIAVLTAAFAAIRGHVTPAHRAAAQKALADAARD